MKIQIHSINQEGRRGDKEDYNPNSKDIYHAQTLIGLYLLSQEYLQGVGTLRVQAQGFGHSAPFVHMPYSSKQALIDSLVYFNPENDSSVLRVSFAVRPEKLESIVRKIKRRSELPADGWNQRDFGFIKVSNDFPRSSYKMCVKDIIDKIKNKCGDVHSP